MNSAANLENHLVAGATDTADYTEGDRIDAREALAYAMKQDGWCKGSLEWRAAEYVDDCGINDDSFENMFELALHDPKEVGRIMGRIAEKHFDAFVDEHMQEIQQRFFLGQYAEKDEDEAA